MGAILISSFAKHLELWEYKRFTRGVWVISDKLKSTIKDQDTLHIKNTKYREIHRKKNSMPFSRSTQNSRANKF